jgi:hypothetical protein
MDRDRMVKLDVDSSCLLDGNDDDDEIGAAASSMESA